MEKCLLMAACVEVNKNTTFEKSSEELNNYWNELLSDDEGQTFLKENKALCVRILEKMEEENFKEECCSFILLKVILHVKAVKEGENFNAVKTYNKVLHRLKKALKVE